MELGKKMPFWDRTIDLVILTHPHTDHLTGLVEVLQRYKGKQELEEELLKNAKVIVDDTEQACHSGEINVPLLKGIITDENIYGTLGEVVAGIKKGRENDEEITIFDSTGLGIQDIICARLVCEKARERKVPVFELL